MITTALFIGFYIYGLLLLGFIGAFFKSTILIITVMFMLTALVIIKSKRHTNIPMKTKNGMNIFAANKLNIILILLIIIQMLINIIGALSPETAFDALWYHLTLAIIYLTYHKIIHISGGLLYYSDMPKFIELLYAAILSFGSEIQAKLVHLVFGIITLIAVYKLTTKKINKTAGIIAAVILSSNLVFSWETTTAYIDLGRGFFEIMSLWTFLIWEETKQQKWLVITSIFLGFCILTKILAFSSIMIIFLINTALQIKEKQIKNVLNNSLIIFGIPLLLCAPWFIFSYLHTGNFIYPFFTPIYQVKPAIQSMNILKLVWDFWNLMLYSSDPISPLYLIILPLSMLCFSKMKRSIKIVFIYSLTAILVWLATPRTGGGRFILPYLPALSIATAATINFFKPQKYLYYSLIGIVCIIALTTCLYRAAAEKKYLPLLLGKETKAKFLAENLNFKFGDFYDIDGYFSSHIKDTDTVLLYGFHNLYYIDFSFIDSSWVKKGDRFNYIAVQNATLPKRFSKWKRIYENNVSHVKLYTDNKKLWTY